jgi:cullin-4
MGTKELVMTVFQAAIILLFHDQSQLTLKQMMKSLNLDEKELTRSLSPLLGCKLLLLKGDKYKINPAFTSVGPKYKVPKAAVDQTIEETKGVEEKLFQNRQHQIDAAIVRIMKEKKTSSHIDLVTELLHQLNFPVDVSFLLIFIYVTFTNIYIIRLLISKRESNHLLTRII